MIKLDNKELSQVKGGNSSSSSSIGSTTLFLKDVKVGDAAQTTF